MNKIFWYILTELRQNRVQATLLVFVSLLLGAGVKIAINSEIRIASLLVKEDWGADLVVLPKGVSLEEFRTEIQKAVTTDFLPEVMFDSTLDMVKNELQLRAILAITDEHGSQILSKGNASNNIGLKALVKQINIQDWREQKQYGTPEWGNKVISGFFAAGPEPSLRKLKDLVNKRTVGKALFIRQQQSQDEIIQDQLQQALLVFSSVMVGLILLSYASLVLWVKLRLNNSFRVLQEIGVARNWVFQSLATLLVLTIIIPSILGFILGSSFSI